MRSLRVLDDDGNCIVEWEEEDVASILNYYLSEQLEDWLFEGGESA